MPSLTAIVPATNSPPTLAACLDAIGAAEQPPEELIVAQEGPGPAAARNSGARQATGDVLVFVDADVLPHPDAFTRIRTAFDAEPELVALLGSYDDSPAAPGAVSGFRNLLHHHVHQEGAGRATTFWAGLGAIRRDAFLDAGGFDESYLTPSIEDIELGVRLASEGARMELDPDLQGTHLKEWTLREMVRTDLWRRGVPWVELLLREGKSSTALNLGWRHRVSAAVSVIGALALLRGRPRVTLASLTALVALNPSFYGLLVRRRGVAQAAVGVGLHALHHVAGAAAVPIALLRHLGGGAPPEPAEGEHL